METKLNDEYIKRFKKQSDAVAEARRALSALYLEVPALIADDVKEKVDAAFSVLQENTELDNAKAEVGRLKQELEATYQIIRDNDND